EPLKARTAGSARAATGHCVGKAFDALGRSHAAFRAERLLPVLYLIRGFDLRQHLEARLDVCAHSFFRCARVTVENCLQDTTMIVVGSAQSLGVVEAIK